MTKSLILQTIIVNFIFDLLKNVLDVDFKNIVIQETQIMHVALVRVIKAKTKIKRKNIKIDKI